MSPRDEERRRADHARETREAEKRHRRRFGRSARSRSARRSSSGPPRDDRRDAALADQAAREVREAFLSPRLLGAAGARVHERRRAAGPTRETRRPPEPGAAARYAASGARVRTSIAVGSRSARFRSTTCACSAAGTTGIVQRTADAGSRRAERAKPITGEPAAFATSADFQSPWTSIVNSGANSRISRRRRPASRRVSECRGRRLQLSRVGHEDRDRRGDCPRAAPRTGAPRPSRPWLRRRARSPPSAARESRRPWKRAERSGGAHPAWQAAALLPQQRPVALDRGRELRGRDDGRAHLHHDDAAREVGEERRLEGRGVRGEGQGERRENGVAGAR